MRTLLVALVAVGVLGVLAPPSAARTSRKPVPTGNDISYPLCGGTFPAGQAFGIVGVNGGLANNANPCLGRYQAGNVTTSELFWAATTSRGTTTQPKASLYVNTADPGNMYKGKPISDWPQSGTTPYGNCTTTVVTTSAGVAIVGTNSPACAYEYGRERATQDTQTFFAGAAKDVNTSRPGSVSANPGDYPWWLDVESANTWQQGASGQQMNVAVLRGMVDYFGTLMSSSSRAPLVGVYALSADWQSITGGTGSSSPLYGQPLWIPGATSKSGAQSKCKATSYTGGPIRLAQLVGTYDNDYVC